jgi:hypothetical protein
MSNRKAVPADLAAKFFQGKSVFFGDQPPEPENSPAPPVLETPPSVQAAPVKKQDSAPEGTAPPQQPSLSSPHQDVIIDVTTSLLWDVDLKEWREQIENTVTQNSSLRLTSEERYVIEDIISELQRKERIKTSMNEVARLGLLFLIHEFKKNRHKSIIYRVKKA